MAELTVGYVAGFIALGIFIAHVLSPTLLTFVLAGILRDKETAATWTIAGRVLQNSYWSEILRSDSSLSHGVRKKVLLVTSTITFTAALVAIAGVVTPLGLYDTLEPSGSATPSFAYVNDPSSFGVATPLRSNLSFSRTCSVGHVFLQGPAPCPYSGNIVIFSWNGTSYGWDLPGGYSTAVAPIVREIYSSGTQGVRTTISNYFDIQWRQYSTTVDKDIDNGTAFLTGSFKFIETMVLGNSIMPVEGLIVDMEAGGIGFRNHTLPKGFAHGATWVEDLLFIEPETSCVNTNLTFDFTINSNASEDFNGQLSELWLTDIGGFASLNQTYPYYDRDDTQANPDLQARAYKAAWLNNALTMVYLNVTNPNDSLYGNTSFSYLNSSYGKQFELPRSDTQNFNTMSIDSDFGSYLEQAIGSVGGTYPNPFNITSVNFTDINTLCSGTTLADIANISNIYVACGLMRGIPQRTDGGFQFMFEGGSKWSAPLYACASTVKASIKTVSFHMNETARDLGSLTVTGVQDKEYPDTSSMPLWGVEDSGLALDGISPVWGLISPEYANFPNISVVRQPSLFLTGTSAAWGSLTLSTTAGQDSENMPGSDFAPSAMNSVYSQSVFDYSGSSSLAMYTRWFNLSRTPENAASIVNLIWTDIAAQGVVGTKGVLGSGNAGLPNETTQITVSPIIYKIKYHYPFGIPAFILAAALLVISLVAIMSAATRRSGLATLRKRLHQSSIGRMFLALRYSAQSNVEMPSKQWNRTMGMTEVDLGNASEDPKALNSTNGGEHAAVVEKLQSTLQSPVTGTADHRDSSSGSTTAAIDCPDSSSGPRYGAVDCPDNPSKTSAPPTEL